MYENEKGRLVEIDKDYIFSKTDKDSKEEILYSPDPDSSNHRYFSVNEMRDYIQGELDARENYKAPLATITGFIVGGTSPFVMWYGIGYPPFYSPMLPAGYTAVVGLTETSRKKIYKNNPEYKDNMFYLMGYREVSKSKRIVNVIKGSLIGLVAGITTGIIISSRDDDDE